MKEDRRIIFDYEEVYKAIYSLCMAKDYRRPPAGQVQKVSEKPGDDTVIILQIKTLDEQVLKLEYGRDFIAAALLTLCRGLGVPIAKRARKSIVIPEDSVVMRVELP